MISMNLKYLRKKLGLSQEELAEKINVSRQSVAKWENGETLPDVQKCNELAILFDTTIDNLMNISFEESDMPESKAGDKFVFGLVKVGERGQIVIPKYARSVFGINPGDRLMVLGDKAKGGIALAKVQGLGKNFK